MVGYACLRALNLVAPCNKTENGILADRELNYHFCVRKMRIGDATMCLSCMVLTPAPSLMPALRLRADIELLTVSE